MEDIVDILIHKVEVPLMPLISVAKRTTRATRATVHIAAETALATQISTIAFWDKRTLAGVLARQGFAGTLGLRSCTPATSRGQRATTMTLGLAICILKIIKNKMVEYMYILNADFFSNYYYYYLLSNKLGHICRWPSRRRTESSKSAHVLLVCCAL